MPIFCEEEIFAGAFKIEVFKSIWHHVKKAAKITLQ